MANIISSAITNKPPPKPVANLLAKRNKIHHLRDGNTDETLLDMFNEQPGGQMKSANFNKCTMPSRNYACITEIPDVHEQQVNGHSTTNGVVPAGETGHEGKDRPADTKDKGRHPLHSGEINAGTGHIAADGISSEGALKGGLNVSIRVEINNENRNGETQGYGLASKSICASYARHDANVLIVPKLTPLAASA